MTDPLEACLPDGSDAAARIIGAGADYACTDRACADRAFAGLARALRARRGNNAGVSGGAGGGIERIGGASSGTGKP